jgi:hypothetical protein
MVDACVPSMIFTLEFVTLAVSADADRRVASTVAFLMRENVRMSLRQ